MSIQATMSKRAVEGGANAIRVGWDRLSKLPGGKVAFSKLIGRMAPYTGSIDARVEELRPGFARVTLRDRHAVRNHLDCIHAIALINLAEVAGNLALSYGLPDDARFIPSGMGIEYAKKARGTITAECTLPPVHDSARREYEVPVRLLNEAGEEVARATIKTLVGPKRGL